MIEETKDQKRGRGLTYILVGVALLGMGVLAIGLYLWFGHYSAPENMNGVGRQLVGLGDYLGGVTTPFLSFLGLIALLYTIRIQSQELALSRREMEESRRELAKAATAQILSAQISAAAAILNNVDKEYNESKKPGEYFHRKLSSGINIQVLMNDLDKSYEELKKASQDI